MDMNQKQMDPFNIQILDPDSFIRKHGCMPVTSFAMYEASSTHFHPNGLFSETIFGQVGSRDRLIRRGYFDLRTKIITPHLYKQILTLKSFYKQILSGTAYAVLGNDGDLELCDASTPKAGTGFSFFLSVLPDIKFAQTSSSKRQDKIDLIYKYRDRLLIDKFIILPAGIRDVRIDKQGKSSSEEINKLYLNMLSFINALPIDGNNDPVYDPIRLQLQNKALEIYEYIASLMEGKHGFAQGKLVARNITYGCRNVITAPPMSKVSSPASAQAFQINEVMIPLFQAMKSAVPVMVFGLKQTYLGSIFNDQSLQVAGIDPDTLNLIHVSVTHRELQTFTTSQGINKLINNYRNPHFHFQPASFTGTDANGKRKNFYMYLVYDDGKDDIFIFRNKDDISDYIKRMRAAAVADELGVKILNKYNFDRNDCVVTGSLAVGLALGRGDSSVISSYDFIAKDAAAKKRMEEIAAKVGDEEDISHFRISIATKEQLIYFTDEGKNKVFTVEQYRVLTPETLLDVYNNSEVRECDRGLIRLLEKSTYNPKYVRPITWTEMFYTTAYTMLYNKHTTATRHPMLLLQNITLNKIKVMSTNVSREVSVRNMANPDFRIVYPQYPVLTSTVKGSMSVHPAHLEKYDGRMVAIVGCNTLYL